MTDRYELYGTPFSMFTGKARSYMEFKQLPYQEVFSSLNIYKKVIIPATGTRIIPVVKLPENKVLQDTANIIDTLEAKYPDRAVRPTLPKSRLVCELFELWSDEWLLLPAMHYRWNKPNFPFLYEEFGRVVSPHMPAFVRRFLGKKVAKRFQGYVPMLGITQHMIPALENWFEGVVLTHLDRHFSEHDFILGHRPSLADVSLMGPLAAHLYHDPAPKQLLEQRAPNLCQWIARMQDIASLQFEESDSDEIPDTLLPLLQNMFEEQWPVLLNTVVELEEWANTYPDMQDIPRSIGKHSFRLGNQKGSRAILTFSQWKLQRVLETFRSFDTSTQQSILDWLAPLGGAEALQFKINKPVIRVGARVKFA